jgi:serine/threonine-protein kinase
MTSGNQALGTPEYMSPEQAQVSADVDGRSDLYALGTILFELLAGHVPYQADVPLQVMMAHVQAPTPRLSDRADAKVSDLVARAMAKAPGDRFVDAEEMRQAVLASVPAAATARIELVARRAETLPTPAPSADALTQPMPAREAQTSLGTTLVVTPPADLPRQTSTPSIAFAVLGAVGIGALVWTLAYRQPAASPEAAQPVAVAPGPTPPAPSTATVTTRPLTESPMPEPNRRTALRFIVTPSEARVEVDGIAVPDLADVARDEHTEHLVTISSPGFRPWSKRVEWTQGRTLTVRLEPLPKQTALPFRSER